MIIAGTFTANFFFDVNIMLLVLIDGLIGLIFMRSHKFD
jgi:chromate transporter